MLGWFIRILFVAAGFIASFFVSRNALNFDLVQMVIAMLLFTLLVAVLAFWPVFKGWCKHHKKKP